MVPPKVENKARISALITSVQHCTGGSSQCTRQEKEMKEIMLGKQEIKLPILMDNMIMSLVKNTKESVKKLLELISEFILQSATYQLYF